MKKELLKEKIIENYKGDEERVTLENRDGVFVVKVGKEIYAKCTNRLMAEQKYNSI